MPRFNIIPTGKSDTTGQLMASDSAGVLRLIYGLECGRAELFEDGAYVFSIDMRPNGMWSIDQNDRQREP